MKVCKSCEQSAGSFKGCKHLNLIGEEDSPELICENCMYTGDYFCAVGAGEQSLWIMLVWIIYDTAQQKKYL